MLLLPIIEDELPCSCNATGCQCTNPVEYDGQLCEQCLAGFCDIGEPPEYTAGTWWEDRPRTESDEW